MTVNELLLMVRQVTFLVCTMGRNIYHALDWNSSKQSSVAFSIIGAEILANATSTDQGFLLAERHQIVYGSSYPLPFIRTVDYNGLYSTIKTLHEENYFRLRPTVLQMRYSFENGEIATMQCIPGLPNISDALTETQFEYISDVERSAQT